MTIMNFQTLFNNTGYILKKEEMRLGLYQQYFSYIVAVSFIGGVPEENHRPVASH
jgi:hypothetical protein